MHPRTADAPRLSSLLLAFLATSLIMGLVAAGVVIPAAGAAGGAAKSGVALFESLPSEFTANPMAQQSKIIDAKGNVIATPSEENRIIVPLSKIAPIMQKAQIAIEDSRFYEHGGIDMRGISRAVVSNVRSGSTQGASTLTQQFVKLTLQENALAEGDDEAAKAAVAKNVTRKVQELKYAVTLEDTMSKDDILQGYLNLAYYGDKAYGVEAASQHYFGHSAAKLNYIEAALLAGTVQSPGVTDPVNNPNNAKARRNVVLARMNQLGMITDAQLAKGKKTTIKSMLDITYPKNTCASSTYPFFCEYVMAWLKQQPSLGKTLPERVKKINRGGLTVKTTLDPTVQYKTVKQIRATVPSKNNSNIGGSATVIEPGTGRVIAMGQSAIFGDDKAKYSEDGKRLLSWNGKTQVNWNVDTKLGGTTGAAIGSTAKMFALVAAMEQGRTPASSVYAPFADTEKAHYFTAADSRDKCSWIDPTKGWPVRNDEPIGGEIPLSTATAKSVNTAFVNLTLSVGACNVYKAMNRFHVVQGNGKPIEPTLSNITLGSGDTTPVRLASAYATLAAGGKYCDPTPVASITLPDGKPVKLPKTKCDQVVKPAVAAQVTQLLRGVVTEGTGRGAAFDGRQVAGKTGTTSDHIESWFVGYTPQRATAVWVGTPLSQTKMQGVCLAGQCYREVFGGTVAAPLFAKVMHFAHEGLPYKNFPSAWSVSSAKDAVDIPSVYGLSQKAAEAKLKKAGFSSYLAGYSNDTIAKGLVAGTSPRSTAQKGQAIGLYLSTGWVPPPAPKPSSPPVQAKKKPTSVSSTTSSSTSSATPTARSTSASPKPSATSTSSTPKPQSTTTKTRGKKTKTTPPPR